VRTRDRRNNRYYDPTTDQLLSVDPLVNQTGTPYAFADGDPVNGTDPDGLATSPACMTCEEIEKAIGMGTSTLEQKISNFNLNPKNLPYSNIVNGIQRNSYLSHVNPFRGLQGKGN